MRINKTLPFSGVGKGKIWWLATINSRTVEVEVSGIKGLSIRELEDAFANSSARISPFPLDKK